MSVAEWVAVIAGVSFLLLVVVEAIQKRRWKRDVAPVLRRLKECQGENVFRLANLARAELHLGQVTSSDDLTPRDIESVVRGLYAERHPDRPDPVGPDQVREMEEGGRTFRHFYVGNEGEADRVEYDRLVPRAMMILDDTSGAFGPKLRSVAAEIMGTPLTRLKTSYAAYAKALEA